MIENWRRHYNTVRPHSAVGIPATCTGGTRLAGQAHSADARSKLTFQPDHSAGTGQPHGYDQRVTCDNSALKPWSSLSENASKTSKMPVEGGFALNGHELYALMPFRSQRKCLCSK